MRSDTIQRKKATEAFKGGLGPIPMEGVLKQVLLEGKQAIDQAVMEVGRIFVEAILCIEREERTGADYHPPVKTSKNGAARMGPCTWVIRK